MMSFQRFAHLALVMLGGCNDLPKAPAQYHADPAGPRHLSLAGAASSVASAARAPMTTPQKNVAGMNAGRYRPTNRSTAIAVAPDGANVAVLWLHNESGGDAFSIEGEPTTYATIGDPADPGSFSAPQVVGKRMFGEVGRAKRRYNSAHNQPFVAATREGGFLGLSVPFNANGWAQSRRETGYGYHVSSVEPGGIAWSDPSLLGLRSPKQGSSLSETSGTFDADGTLHVFGQGHLGAAQGGMAYQRLTAGGDLLDTVTLGAAYRPLGLYYFGEGAGFVSRRRNASGNFDLHVAFSWNKRGSSPMYGLYHLLSTDGGNTWANAAGQTVDPPLHHSNNVAAVVPAKLTSGSYGGAIPGVHGISLTVSPSGVPVIVRPNFDANHTRTQATVYSYANGRWVVVPVGPPLFWNHGGTGVAFNETTGRINVVLLDPGSAEVPARVLLYHQPLSDLLAGKDAWTQEVVASVFNGVSHASSLKVAEVPNRRFVVIFEPNYVNPGRVEPVLLEAPMR